MQLGSRVISSVVMRMVAHLIARGRQVCPNGGARARLKGRGHLLASARLPNWSARIWLARTTLVVVAWLHRMVVQPQAPKLIETKPDRHTRVLFIQPARQLASQAAGDSDGCI